MSYQFTLSMIPLALGALVSFAMAFYTWQNRKAIGATSFAVMMLMLYEWEICYIFQLAGTDLPTKLFWDKLMFVGVVATPVAWLAFALEYTRRKTWLTAGRLISLSIFPLLTITFILTNELHQLFWTKIALTYQGGFFLLDNINGPWFWMHALYSYTLITIGMVLIVRALLRWPKQYRAQMTWILLATLTPFIANIIFVFKIVPILIDITSFALTFSAIGLAFALFHHRLLDIAPIARDIVVDGMKDGMIVLDANRRIVDINRAAQQMIGLSSDQPHIGKPVAEILSKWPELIQRYRDLLEAKDEVSIGEGENQRWIELTLSTLLDENKSILGRVLTGRDITDRKQAESKLQESEARFRQIVENANDVIYRVDNNGYVTYANPATMRILGYESEKDVVGRHYLELVAPDARAKVRRAYVHQFLSKTPTTYHELPIIAGDGSETWLGQKVQLIQESGQVMGFQALARDITEIKQAQDALRLARDQALEANLAKTRLLSKVSHELRTPLGGILGYAELLQRNTFGELNEKQQKAASQIIESSDYLATMVNELLDEAQLRSSAATLHETVFSPTTLIQQATAGMDILAQKKGLEFSSQVDPNLPQAIYGDDRRIRQIVINLIGNALKFTKKGSVHLNVTCQGDNYWGIQVIDTGIGVPAEAQETIFEPFQQVHSNLTNDNRGIGLGLSITKQLVELMNGKIVVESELGKGSTFTVLLPIKGVG
ncbi:MAG TPA: histidine kinase N-terminal 7TM domain-containing protein [Anaerolineales bacterium]|nr:histidine kinase N-terminal 7TM domain-containing protein [Anaerolineales bacterium]